MLHTIRKIIALLLGSFTDHHQNDDENMMDNLCSLSIKLDFEKSLSIDLLIILAVQLYDILYRILALLMRN